MEVGEGSRETHPPISHKVDVDVVNLVKKSNNKCVKGKGNGRPRRVKKVHVAGAHERLLIMYIIHLHMCRLSILNSKTLLLL